MVWVLIAMYGEWALILSFKRLCFWPSIRSFPCLREWRCLRLWISTQETFLLLKFVFLKFWPYKFLVKLRGKSQKSCSYGPSEWSREPCGFFVKLKDNAHIWLHRCIDPVWLIMFRVCVVRWPGNHISSSLPQKYVFEQQWITQGIQNSKLAGLPVSFWEHRFPGDQYLA